MLPSVTVAPLGVGDRDAAVALLDGERARELLGRSFAETRECRALAATIGGSLAGIVLHGEVAGAAGTGALLWIAVRPDRRRRGIGTLLLRRAVEALDAEGVRHVIAELAHAAGTAPAESLLAAHGFTVEGEVPDYYRDGVALRIWRRAR